MNHWGRGFNLPGSIHLNPQPPHIDEHTNPLASHGFGLAHRFVVQKILGGSGHTLNKKKIDTTYIIKYLRLKINFSEFLRNLKVFSEKLEQ